MASLFTTSYKPAPTTWTVVGMLVSFNAWSEYATKLKMFGVIKVDSWKRDRKKASPGMHDSLEFGVLS